VGDVRSSSSSIEEVSLAATTPAGNQQAVMQQLMAGMQELWLAEVATDGAAPCHAGPTQQQDATEAPPPAAKRQAAQKQKQHRKQQGKQAPTAASARQGHVEEKELQQQQQQQQELADQHYQRWLQQQAEAAAAAQLQALELEATAAAELTPLQQMLKACGQGVSVACPAGHLMVCLVCRSAHTGLLVTVCIGACWLVHAAVLSFCPLQSLPEQNLPHWSWMCYRRPPSPVTSSFHQRLTSCQHGT
jgi:hypothetical protein